jgi:hypothetical protein
MAYLGEGLTRFSHHQEQREQAFSLELQLSKVDFLLKPGQYPVCTCSQWLPTSTFSAYWCCLLPLLEIRRLASGFPSFGPRRSKREE